MELVWTKNISVGVPKIDDQHQFLFYIINKLERMKGELSGEELENYVDSLSNYVQIHFQTEEEFFYRFDFADKLEHEKEHGLFVDKIMEYRQKLENSEPVSVDDLYAFLSSWIKDHIQGSDMKFKGLFSE